MAAPAHSRSDILRAVRYHSSRTAADGDWPEAATHGTVRAFAFQGVYSTFWLDQFDLPPVFLTHYSFDTSMTVRFNERTIRDQRNCHQCIRDNDGTTRPYRHRLTEDSIRYNYYGNN